MNQIPCDGTHMPQPHKGERDLVISRPPKVVADAVKAQAHKQGMSVSEYVARILADHHELHDAMPPVKPRQQKELPLTG